MSNLFLSVRCCIYIYSRCGVLSEGVREEVEGKKIHLNGNRIAISSSVKDRAV